MYKTKTHNGKFYRYRQKLEKTVSPLRDRRRMFYKRGVYSLEKEWICFSLNYTIIRDLDNEIREPVVEMSNSSLEIIINNGERQMY